MHRDDFYPQSVWLAETRLQVDVTAWYNAYSVLVAGRNTGWTTYRGRAGRILKIRRQLVTAHGQCQPAVYPLHMNSVI